MFRMKSLTAGIMVAALVTTGIAFAQGPRGGGPFGGRGGRGGPGGPGGPGLALGALNLTDTQRDQVRDIRERYREQTQPLAARLDDLREQQRTAIEAIPVDETRITSATQDLVQAQVELAIQEARLNADIWALLTPEQQAQATKARAAREARQAERREQMQQRRPRQ